MVATTAQSGEQKRRLKSFLQTATGDGRNKSAHLSDCQLWSPGLDRTIQQDRNARMIELTDSNWSYYDVSADAQKLELIVEPRKVPAGQV